MLKDSKEKKNGHIQRRKQTNKKQVIKKSDGTISQKQYWQLEVNESAPSKFQENFVFNLELQGQQTCRSNMSVE